MSGLIPDIKTHFSRPGKHIAVVEVNDVYKEFEDIFDFIHKFRDFTDDEWDAKLLRDDRDRWTGNYIILATHPNKIHARDANGNRVYIVETKDGLDPDLVYDHINQ